ncbi:MAG: site-specific DNA-methyltransferase [Thermoguttaceae bacterium]
MNMAQQPETLDLRSHDIAEDKRLDILRLLPEIRTEGGKIDFERLKLALGEAADVGRERYGMNWPGKAECFKTIQAPSLGTLRPRPEESVNFDTTENLIIEGDNLEVLKLLQKSYLGKVKMIYIDPPYNTGNDFIYPDDFSENLLTYLRYTGQLDLEGKRFGTNLDTDGRFHSKWLNMMYPRLYLARNLMRDDGVIFVSIDDKEVENLRAVMNEVFGEENFIAAFVWTTKKGAQGIPTSHLVVSNHEYIMAYAKNEQCFRFLGLDREEGDFANPDDDPRGLWKRQYLQRFGQGFKERTIVNPKNGMVFKFETPYTQDKMEEWIRDGRIIFPEDSKNYPARKEFLSEYENRKQLVTYLDLFPTKASTERLYALFDGSKIYPNPKPDKLIQFLVQVTSATTGDIILDFFAGSGTTAHAVLNQNVADGVRRKYILVQLPEPTRTQNDDSSWVETEASRRGLLTISAVTRDRVRRAGQAIAKEADGKLALKETSQPDLGFRAFNLAESNFTTWDAGIEHEPQALEHQLELHIDHIRDSRTPDDIFYELLLKSGFSLTTPVEKLPVTGKTVFSVASGALIICMEPELTLDLIRAIAEKKPERVICLDEGFVGNDQLKANAAQIFKTKDVIFKTV